MYACSSYLTFILTICMGGSKKHRCSGKWFMCSYAHTYMEPLIAELQQHADYLYSKPFTSGIKVCYIFMLNLKHFDRSIRIVLNTLLIVYQSL